MACGQRTIQYMMKYMNSLIESNSIELLENLTQKILIIWWICTHVSREIKYARKYWVLTWYFSIQYFFWEKYCNTILIQNFAHNTVLQYLYYSTSNTWVDVPWCLHEAASTVKNQHLGITERKSTKSYKKQDLVQLIQIRMIQKMPIRYASFMFSEISPWQQNTFLLSSLSSVCKIN